MKLSGDDEMIIQRPDYLNKLISKRQNGQIKIITGVRRCGKSFLLFNLFKTYLLENGVNDAQIICIALDNALNVMLRDPLALANHLNELTDGQQQYYVFLDEIQFVGEKKVQENPDIYLRFYDVLSALQQKGNVDIYVTGSNSKMLSNDIATEFRGRGDVIHIAPLSFSEFYAFKGGPKEEAFKEYMIYGGYPAICGNPDGIERKQYLSRLFNETYLKDIVERHDIDYPEALGKITDALCSSVGSLTNSSRITRTLKSAYGTDINCETTGKYIDFLCESYLFYKAYRFDVKGRKYLSFPYKYYCVDPGLRNARLNFRQIEETHLMENIIYNELVARGMAVDVGMVEKTEKVADKRTTVAYEIDFVVNANAPGEKYYIQSALNMDSPEKESQELRPFLQLNKDFTKRMVVSKTMLEPWQDEYGILHIGIYDFLLDFAKRM